MPKQRYIVIRSPDRRILIKYARKPVEPKPPHPEQLSTITWICMIFAAVCIVACWWPYLLAGFFAYGIIHVCGK